MFEKLFIVDGITCQACVKLIEKRISKIEGVTLVEISENGNSRVLAENEIELTKIQDALIDTEYKIS